MANKYRDFDNYLKEYPDAQGYFGKYGGAYIPPQLENAFKEINEAFMSTFTEIFGGGSAFLKLEDQGDILECGIDISVEMPGKGTRAISLLSGGEKAFVAIALYFAIIKVSPTPFCVLD